jgi:hypothetical protein
MGQDVGLGKALRANPQDLTIAPACWAGKHKANDQQKLFEIHGTDGKVNSLSSVLHSDWPREAAADLDNL